jgi:hypothetical protein
MMRRIGGTQQERAMRLSIFPLLIALLIATTSVASAQGRCRVMDPTGTPLNVRATPNGQIIGSLPNGLLVTILDVATDNRGRPWALISQYESGRRIGWVFREFIACF